MVGLIDKGQESQGKAFEEIGEVNETQEQRLCLLGLQDA